MSETLKSSEYYIEAQRALTKLSQQLKVDGICCSGAQAAIGRASDELRRVAIDIDKKLHDLQYGKGNSENA